MSQIVKLRRSSVSGQKPTNTNLQLGELALNTTDGKVFMAVSGSGGPSVEELILTNTVNTGSINLIGSVSASAFSGSAEGLFNVPFVITGSDVDGNNYDKKFTKLHFDSETGLNVSESNPGTAFISIGSHFRDIFVSGSGMLRATGSDAFEVVSDGGIDITVSNTDTNTNGYTKELKFSTLTLSSSLNTRINNITGSLNDLTGTFNSFTSSTNTHLTNLDNFTSSVVLTNQTSSMTVLSASYALTAAFALNAGAGGGGGSGASVGSYSSLEQTVAATTWSFEHNIGQRYPIFQVFNTNGDVIIPTQIRTIDENNAEIIFGGAQTGRVIASLGGGNGTTEEFTNSALWTVDHNLGTDYPDVTVWDSNRNIIFPNRIESVNSNQIKIYFSIPVSGHVSVSRGGHILSGSVNWVDIGGKPSGIVSGSSQLTGSYDARYVLSGSITQTTWDNIASKPNGIVSGSEQLTGSYDTRYVLSGSITQTTWDNIANKPNGIVSGSVQVDITGTTGYSTFSSSISTSIGGLSSSIATTDLNQDNRISSLETASGSIRTDFNTFTSSYTAVSGSIDSRLDVLEAYSGSQLVPSSSMSFRTLQTDVYCKNMSGTQINKGTVVRITGAVGDNPLIGVASLLTEGQSANTLGIATENIPNDSFGLVITEGVLTGVNTDGMTAGQLLFLGANGTFTTSYPVAPNHGVRLGEVLRVQQQQGSIYVRIDNGSELGEAHDVYDTTTNSSYGDLLVKSGSVWINSKNLNGDYTVTGSLTITQNLTVLGSSSLVYVTSSQLAVSASFISVNVFEPAERFGGIKVYDSGSSDATASLAWDSLHNHWVYQNVSGSNYSGGMLLSGPRNSGSLGDEPGLISGRIVKSVGGDHIDVSIISETGTTITVAGDLVANSITGAFDFFGLVNRPTLVSGSSQIVYSGLTGIPNGIVSGSLQVSELGFLETSSFNTYTSSNDGRVSSIESKTGSYATTGSNTFLGNQTITGSLDVTGSVIRNRNGAIGQYMSSEFGGNVGVYNRSNLTEIGLALDGAEWTTNWSNGPILYVNNTPGDTYEGVFGFQNKANYSDGRITALKPMAFNSGATITGSVVISGSLDISNANVGSSRYLHTQTNSSTTWSISHNLGYNYPNVTVYDGSNNRIMLPADVISVNANTTEVTFATPEYGFALVSVGGVTTATADRFLFTATSATGSWVIDHNLGYKYPNIDVYDNNDEQLIPQKVKAVSVNRIQIDFSTPTSGNAVITLGGPRSTSIFNQTGSFYTTQYNIGITGSLVVTGDVDADNFNTTSDKKLKTDLLRIEGALDKIEKLNGYTFNWLEEYNEDRTRQIGLLADEVYEVQPELITKRHVSLGERREEIKLLDYSKVTALLLEGIKELTERVTKLENKRKKK